VSGPQPCHLCRDMCAASAMPQLLPPIAARNASCPVQQTIELRCEWRVAPVCSASGTRVTAQLRRNLFADRQDDAGYGRYIDAAMRWGAAHAIGVMIDIHAAPGSQNGCGTARV